jgi:hypothetical protein
MSSNDGNPMIHLENNQVSNVSQSTKIPEDGRNNFTENYRRKYGINPFKEQVMCSIYILRA